MPGKRLKRISGKTHASPFLGNQYIARQRGLKTPSKCVALDERYSRDILAKVTNVCIERVDTGSAVFCESGPIIDLRKALEEFQVTAQIEHPRYV